MFVTLLWGRRGVPQRFHDGSAFKVSARPYCGERQMVGDGHVNDPSTLVREDDEHEDHPERGGRHDEEVDGNDLSRVVREERSPRL